MNARSRLLRPAPLAVTRNRRFGAWVSAAAVLAGAVILCEPLLAQTGWPPALEERVVGQIADVWNVPAEEVFLEWGEYKGVIPAADAPITLVGNGSNGHWVVRVEVAESKAASVRVRAGHLRAQAVAARRIARGEILAEGDIETTASVVWQAPDRNAPQRVQPGWEAQRVVEKGDVLRTPTVRPPFAVRLGARVEIVWARGPIELSVPGKAAESAVLGEDVLVRTDSGARIRGLVIAPGVVDISDALERTSGGNTP